MTPIENQKSGIDNPPEALPLSLLNDFLYCPRRAALKIVEGWRSANAHTARGDIVHEHADLPGYEVAKGATLLRALPVFSERLGLSGKCDIVEVFPGGTGDPPVPSGDPPDGMGITLHGRKDSAKANRKSEMQSEPPHVHPPQSTLRSTATDGCCYEGRVGSYSRMFPVEFKLGKRREFENDDVQLCAQALCLEEMFGVAIPRGAIFHAQSKRRREVEFNADLRARTGQAVADLHKLLAVESVPPARYIEGRCEECSLFEICLPRLTQAQAASATAAATRRLYQT